MSQVLLLEYQESWPEQFSAVAGELRAAMAAPNAVIEHIGSTSVPMLCAKPVLDIMIGVSSLAEIGSAVPALVAADFAYRNEYEREIPDRLRAEPKLRESYANLKQHLAAQHAADKASYTKARAPFVREVLASTRAPLGH